MSLRTVLIALAGLAMLGAAPKHAPNKASPKPDIATACDIDRASWQRPETLQAMIVTRGPQLHFQEPGPGCPGAAACQRRPYVVAGDAVLALAGPKGWMCAIYPNRIGGNSGFLPAGRLAGTPARVGAPPLDAWVGKWSEAGADITIKRRGDLLEAEGQAIWPAFPSRDQIDRGAIHTGEMRGETRPAGDTALFVDAEDTGPDGCRVAIRMVGPYLSVSDNNACGGANVSFAGLYRRASD